MNDDLNVNIAQRASVPRKGGFVHLVDTDGSTHLPALIAEVLNESTGDCEIVVQGNATTANKRQQASHNETSKTALTWHWAD